MFERRLPGRSAIVGLLEEVNRAGKRAARRAARVIYTRSVHVHQAAEPSSPASPAPLHAHVPTTQYWANDCAEVPRPIERRKRAVANDGAETKLSPQQPLRRPRRRLAGARWAGALIAGVCRLCRHYSNLKNYGEDILTI